MRARRGAKLPLKNAAPVQGRIDLLDGLSLVGRVTSADAGAAPPAITLAINGRRVETIAISAPRPEQREGASAGAATFDFKIEVPVDVWSVAGNPIRFEVLADGKPLATPFELHRSSLLRALESLFGKPLDDQEGQYRALFALEHIKHGGLLGALGPLARERAIAVARQFGLLANLGERNPIPALEEPGSAGREPNQVIVEQALRSLSDRMEDESQSCLAHVQAILEEKGFAGDLEKWFLTCCIPLLAEHDELLGLSRTVSFSSFHFLEKGGVWELSMASAIAMAEGEVERAQSLLYKLADDFAANRGWINFECLFFSVRHLSRLLAAGLATQEQVESYHYALMFFVEQIGSGWFSRLYDEQLVGAVAHIIWETGRGRRPYAAEMAAKAICHYGLSPTFWSKVGDAPILSFDPDLRVARNLFLELQRYIEAGSGEIVKNVRIISKILGWFETRGNPDARIFRRDVSALLMQQDGSVAFDAPHPIIRNLAGFGRPERLRLAAFPFARFCEAGEASSHPVTYDLREAIRESSPYPAGEQAAVCQALFKEAVGLAEAADTEGFDRILYLFSGLIGLPEEWPGLDALTFALCHALDGAGAARRLTSTVVNAFERLASTPDLAHVPQPALVALERLERAARLRPVTARVRRALHCEPEELPAPAARKRADAVRNVFTDTLVVVYSCQANLDTRVRAIRETWIEDLKQRKIPYLIAVGGGDDRVRGDVLHLDVSDDYEDLPKKTLALLRHALTLPGINYLIKVDDDCYLNVEEFFEGGEYRKHHYFGRRINRPLGGTDRTWHQAKSRTEAARVAFDKSPEPSAYADGGGGYALSRYAMRQIMTVLEGGAGKSLVARSFMEDKLVGDLLNLVGIECQSPGYLSYQRRSLHRGGMPVGMWENIFYPSATSGVAFAHLDNGSQQEAHRIASEGALLPKKIWPTCADATMVPDSNQLELLTDVAKAAGIVAKPVAVVSVVRNELTMLPHFLEHYRALGIESFCFVDNLSEDGTREFLVEQPDVVLYSADTQYSGSHFGVAWQQAVLANHFLGKWVIAADADELLVYRGWRSIAIGDLCEDMAAEGCDAGKVMLVDMYPEGDLSEADFRTRAPFEAAPWYDRAPLTPWRLSSGNFSNDSSVTSSLRHRLDAGAPPHTYTAQKIALFRYQPWLRFGEGLHFAANARVSPRTLWFAHFKYHSGFAAKALEEVRRRQHYNDAAEYRRYRELLAEGLTGFRYEGSVRFDPTDDSAFQIDRRSFVAKRPERRKAAAEQPLVAAGRFSAPGITVAANAAAREVQLDENLVADGYRHLDITARNVMLEGETWPRVRLKFARQDGASSVEFRETEDWPVMFEDFPAVGHDEYGSFLVLSLWEPFKIKNRRDRLLAEAVVVLLPAWVEQITSGDGFDAADAAAWREAARDFRENYAGVLAVRPSRTNGKRLTVLPNVARRGKVKR